MLGDHDDTDPRIPDIQWLEASENPWGVRVFDVRPVTHGMLSMTLLLDRGSSVDVRSSEGATPLMNAVQSGRLDKVSFLLDHGADVNARDQRGFTPLHRAAEMGHTDVVKLLLDRGASPNPEADVHPTL